MKKMILKEVGTLYAYDFSPLELINEIKQLIELHGDTLSFDKFQETHTDSWYTAILIDVLESDYEYEKRLQRDAFTKKGREDYERQTYDRLKAKFEN
jgi:hypothetical protein